MSTAPHRTGSDDPGRALAWMAVCGPSFAHVAATAKVAGGPLIVATAVWVHRAGRRREAD